MDSMPSPSSPSNALINSVNLRIVSLAVVVLFATFVATSRAEEPEKEEFYPRFELTPFAGYVIGGEFEEENSDMTLDVDESSGAGLIFNLEHGPETQWELFFSSQSTSVDAPGLGPGSKLDLDIQYFHFGGTYQFYGEQAIPYLVATVGLSRFDPKPGGFDAETYFSFRIGGGLNLFPHKRVGLRLEGSAISSFVDNDGEIFCRSGPMGATCAITIDGRLFWQLQAFAGLIVRF